MSIAGHLETVQSSLPAGVKLVVVSKTRSHEEIMEAYAAGYRVFGENRIMEMVDKYDALPKDIAWHMIGHVQSKKVKHMAAFVDLVHGIDTPKLFEEVNKQAERYGRVQDVLLQLHIAEEETKFGFRPNSIDEFLSSGVLENSPNVRVRGLMGMATFTSNQEQVAQEFELLSHVFKRLQNGFFVKDAEFNTLSMGMSGDYLLAIKSGSNMVRVGSAIFGPRA